MSATRDGRVRPFLDEATEQRVKAALAMLAQAQAYACDVGADPWEFAIEIACFEKQGVTAIDLRWLLCKGYLRHATDQSEPGSHRRCIRSDSLGFVANSCFAITHEGLRFLERKNNGKWSSPAPEPSSGRPYWDRDRQELRLGLTLIKRFKLPAPNQILILAAFQEENWPFRIFDPLPRHPEIDPKRRLHHTLIALNRNHKHQVIRFQGDGSGEGVCWELTRDGQLIIA